MKDSRRDSVETQAHDEQRLSRALTGRYIVGLALVASLATAAWISLVLVISAQEGTAAVVNISGRQRMLSQRTALLALQLVQAPAAERPPLRERLRRATDLMQDSHRALIEGNPDMRLPGKLSEAVRILYFDGEPSLDLQIERYLEALRGLLATDDAHLVIGHPALRYILTAGPNDLLRALDAMVSQYQREGEAAVGQLHRIETAVWLLTLLLLVMEAAFIFRPFTHRMRQLIGALKTAQDALERHLESLEERVASRTRELQDSRDHLEERVAQRTAELETARRGAEVANAAKTAFLANMSHEIRTPLNAIVGTAHLMGHGPLDDRQRHDLQTIQAASRNLLALISDILDLAKIEADEMAIERIPFALPPLFENLDHLFGPQIRAKGIDFHLPQTPAIDSPPLLGDPHKIQQMLTNLIGNALKFTEHGSIRVDLAILAREADRIHLRFTVTDTGLGIDPEVLPSLFQPFTQADASTTRTHGGTGLGLSLVRRMSERMGGDTGVESQPGVGSRFWFQIPVEIAPEDISRDMAPSPETVSPNPAPEHPQTARLSGVRVLVVDDSRLNLSVCERLLRHEGARPTLCESGAAALREIAADPLAFDIVLMDLQMPGMDGYETTARLRGLTGDASPRIIALTAGVLAKEQSGARSAGMDDFLTKPIDPIQLIRAIRYHAAHTGDRPLQLAPDPECAAAPNDTDWPEIEGLELAQVRVRLADDRSLFLDLIGFFLDESTDLMDRARQALISGSTDRVAALVHRQRGQAANIGAMRLSDGLARLERQALAGQVPSLEDLDQIALETERLRERLSAWRDCQTGTAQPRGQTLKDMSPLDPAAMTMLQTQLSRQTIEALGTYQGLTPALSEHLAPEDFARLDRAMKALDFRSALAELETLAQPNPPDAP